MPKPHRIVTPNDLDRAIAALIAADRRLHGIIERVGRLPHSRRRQDGFESLLGIVAAQQLSIAAADTIFGRVKQKVVPFDPSTFLATDAEILRACGLSAPKQKHMASIATAILEGRLDLSRVRRMADDEARAHLTAIKGIGPWTANIYLMFCLGRADIWPSNDVALQAAVARVLRLRKRPDEKAMESLAQIWRPYRTVAARLFWIHEDGFRRAKRIAKKRGQAARTKDGTS